MSKESQLKFLRKLHEELAMGSKEYRRNVANFQTHTFSLRGRELNKAIRALIGAYFPNATKTKQDKVVKRCQPAMNKFIKAVGQKVKRTSVTSDGIHSVKVTKRTVIATFDATGGNRYEKVYNQYARGANYVKTFTNEILDIFQEEFGAVPGKEVDGKLVEVEAGDIFNLEHAHQRGSLESLVKDSISNAVADSEKHTKAEVNKFFDKNGISLELIRDTKTDTMQVFLGSKIINLEEAAISNAEVQKLNAALEKAIRQLESNGNKLSYMEGSPSFAEVKELDATEKVLASFRNKKGHKVSKKEKVRKGKSSSKLDVSSAKNLGTPLAKKKLKKRKAKKSKAGAASTPLQLVASLNKVLPGAIRKNMNEPALVNRSGRFADSVEVTDVITTKKGFPSIGYTYDRDNYGQYEITSGSRFADAQRDPRKLIDGSIREIAAKAAIGRFFTRRN